MNVSDRAMVFIMSTLPENDSFESFTQKVGRRIKKGEPHKSYKSSPM